MSDVAFGSDMESDSGRSSVDVPCGASDGGASVSSSVKADNVETVQLEMRVESLQQENRVLRMELETMRCRCKGLEQENKDLKRARVNIQLMAEQQEEYISNTLLKKIEALKNEKEQLARNYEQEEEFLTNDLSRKLMQLRNEKSELEGTLAREQEHQMEKLLKRIDRLQNEVSSKQETLDQLKKDKVELENQLEQEQEALVNRLWKRMDKLEAEKRALQEKLEQPISAPSSPPPPRSRSMPSGDSGVDVASSLAQNIQTLKAEVTRLQSQLRIAQTEHQESMERYAEEERQIRQENVRLQRKLQMEIERREQMCRRLSESESSIEMDEERHFNEMSKLHDRSSIGDLPMSRSVGMPVPGPGPVSHSPASARPLSPGLVFGMSSFCPPSSLRTLSSAGHHPVPLSTSSPAVAVASGSQKSDENFAKPHGIPPSPAQTAHHTASNTSSDQLS